MKLEQQVCSLDLAKKLKELGVKQESLFSYWDKEIVCEIRRGVLLDQDGWPNQVFEREELYAAFTVAELGEMLPFFVNKNHVWAGQLMCVRHPRY